MSQTKRLTTTKVVCNSSTTVTKSYVSVIFTTACLRNHCCITVRRLDRRQRGAQEYGPGTDAVRTARNTCTGHLSLRSGPKEAVRSGNPTSAQASFTPTHRSRQSIAREHTTGGGAPLAVKADRETSLTSSTAHTHVDSDRNQTLVMDRDLQAVLLLTPTRPACRASAGTVLRPVPAPSSSPSPPPAS